MSTPIKGKGQLYPRTYTHKPYIVNWQKKSDPVVETNEIENLWQVLIRSTFIQYEQLNVKKKVTIKLMTGLVNRPSYQYSGFAITLFIGINVITANARKDVTVPTNPYIMYIGDALLTESKLHNIALKDFNLLSETDSANTFPSPISLLDEL